MKKQICVGCGIVLLAVAGTLYADPSAALGAPQKHLASRVIPLRSNEALPNQTDLAPLRAIIGEARVVALGEPAHGVHEPLVFRNRLLEYLVLELGFTAIAVECGFPESRRVADFIAGGPGTAEEVVGDIPSWSPQVLEENVQLVRWLRTYNTRPGVRRPIRFYAIDMSYTGPWGSRPTPAGIESALAYLGRADRAAAKTFQATFKPWLRRLAAQNVVLTMPEHNAFTSAIDDLLAQLERERVTYLAVSPAADYDWAHQATLVTRQADRMWRVAPPGAPDGPVPPSAWRMINARDAAMAENVLWALASEGPASRVLFVAHNFHVQIAPTTGGPWDALERMPTSTGQNLRSVLGCDLVAIGMKEASSVLNLEAEAGHELPRPFLIDLRSKRPDASTNQSFKPASGFDALVVIDALTSAQVADKSQH